MDAVVADEDPLSLLDQELKKQRDFRFTLFNSPGSSLSSSSFTTSSSASSSASSINNFGRNDFSCSISVPVLTNYYGVGRSQSYADISFTPRKPTDVELPRYSPSLSKATGNQAAQTLANSPPGSPTSARKTKSTQPQRSTLEKRTRNISKRDAPGASNSPPPYMGDILDDIFGGSFRTPGVKASEDTLNSHSLTPAMAFEELQQLRVNPALFLLFYQDTKEHTMLESLHFIMEVEEFIALPDYFRTVREKDIYDTYIVAGSPSEINVPDSIRKTIEEKIGKSVAGIFLEAQKYVTHMLIRNVDSTWNYKSQQVREQRVSKSDAVKRMIEKAVQDERIAELINYFTTRRITTMMYQARTSLVSIQRKARSGEPVGHLVITLRELNGFRSDEPITMYINGKTTYSSTGSLIHDKKTKTRTTPKKGVTSFVWNEKLTFDVKDLETQGIEFHLWEKKFTPNACMGWFSLQLKQFIPNETEEFKYTMSIDVQDRTGKVLMDIHYIPNEEELQRRNEKVRKTTISSLPVQSDPQFAFLF